MRIIAEDVGFKLIDENDKKICHTKTLTAAAACLYYLSGKDLPESLVDVARHAIEAQDKRRARRARRHQRLQQNEATDSTETSDSDIDVDLETDLPKYNSQGVIIK